MILGDVSLGTVLSVTGRVTERTVPGDTLGDTER